MIVPTRKKTTTAANAAELARVQEALRQSEVSRRESQAFFERSFHGNPTLMSIASAEDRRIIEVNPSLVRASGYTREELIGSTTEEIGLWARDEQRLVFLDLLGTTGTVRDFEAEFRTKSGTHRSILVNADIIELGGRKCMLTVGVDVTERRRREKIQSATYAISQAVLGSNDLLTLLGKVHRIIGGLVPARNFYVALLNSDRSMLSFPYFVDEKTPQPQPRAPRNGLTEYVIETRQPLLAGHEEIVGRLKLHGNYSPQGNPSAQWLGAPLIVDDRCIGVITVQDYHNPIAYTQEDLRLMLFVAEQTAAAIHRQTVEAAQREARAYFEKSFHSSPALMAITRVTDGLITEANPAFLRGIGYARDEVLGKTTLEIGLWASATQRDDYLLRLREEGAVRDLAAEIRGKNGQIRTLLINADLIELGGIHCALTVGIDITERRRREKVQTATYQISQALLTGGDLPDLFAEVHRIIGSLMPAKNLYIALLSADGSELLFPYFMDEYVPPPEPRPIGKNNGFTEYVLHTGIPSRVTAAELPELLTKRGQYFPLERPAAQRLGAPLRVNGRAIGVIALQDYECSDAYGEEDLRLLNFVAEQAAVAVQRRQTEAAAARAQQRYQSIFENAVEGLYVSTPEGRFLSANPALARMLGYASSADLLKAVNDIKRQIYTQPNRRDDFFALVQRSDSLSDFESEIFRADGSKIWISESVRVVRRADGTIDHFEGVATDITQRREAARALREAKEAADAASRAKSYFLASVSHELRTPLNGILGYTQILRRDQGLTEKQRDGVRVIHESADHLLALINDVLDLSKIEAGRIELNATDFSLPEFASGVERVFTPRAKEKSILFETAVAADLPAWVHADEQRLRQVVFNLLSNAVKFTKAGGVVFSVQRIGNADGGQVIRFSVSDTGVGISPDDMAKLFQPFAQVGTRTSGAATGTGLGLAISRSLVERMGGKLKVESKLGWGSRFWFDVTVPVVTTAPVAVASTRRRLVGYEGRRRRVLIVDDNAANRSVMVDMLAPLGFDYTETATGSAAVLEAKRFQPDLVLMDLRLPGEIDGLEATRRLRRTERGPALRIIAVSASAYDLDRTECFAAGCDEFLAKPFREEELWAMIERALGLTWRYAEVDETRVPFGVAMYPPPIAEATAIYELAAKGDVVALRARAQALIEMDAKYTPFAQGVLDLASRFKMKAVRQFVARYTH